MCTESVHHQQFLELDFFDPLHHECAIHPSFLLNTDNPSPISKIGCQKDKVSPYLGTEMFLRAHLPLEMIIGGSICPSPVAARTTVSRCFSAPLDLTETVFAPFWLTVHVLFVVMSKYKGVSSMLTIMLSGYFDSFLTPWMDWRKVAIFSSRAAGSFCATDVLARKERLFHLINSWILMNPI